MCFFNHFFYAMQWCKVLDSKMKKHAGVVSSLSPLILDSMFLCFFLVRLGLPRRVRDLRRGSNLKKNQIQRGVGGYLFSKSTTREISDFFNNNENLSMSFIFFHRNLFALESQSKNRQNKLVQDVFHVTFSSVDIIKVVPYYVC